MATMVHIDTTVKDGQLDEKKTETHFDAVVRTHLGQNKSDVFITVLAEPLWPTHRVVQNTVRMTHEEAIELIEELINTVEPNAFAMDMENL